MGFWDFLKENDIEQRNSNNALSSLGNQSVSITEETVLKIPTVQKCVELIAGTIAQLPIYLYKEGENGEIERIRDDREYVLNDEPNEFQSSYMVKKKIIKDYLLYGSSYTAITKKGNEVVEIVPLDSDKMTITKFYKGHKISSVKLEHSGDGGSVEFKPHQVITILKDSNDGFTSKGVLDYGEDIFSIIFSEYDYSKTVYNNGALPSGVLETDGRLTEPTVQRLRNSWNSLYSGVKNAGKTVILEEGLKYKPITMNPSDLQLSETKERNISEICKLFNIPEDMVNPSKSRYSSIEQNNIYFLQYCISPILGAFESALNKNLLLEDEKQDGYFFQFDTGEILKTTEKEKYETVKVGLESGIISVNEARHKVNQKGIKDDVMKWSLGDVLYYPSTGEMIVPNTSIGVEREASEKDSTDDSNND